MYKRLRILVPTIQVLLVVGTFAWYKFPGATATFVQYAAPARDIVIKLNFPLVFVWEPILYFGDKFAGELNPTRLVTEVAGLVVLIGTILASVAVFWTFAVAEVDARLRGESLMRFKNLVGELLKDVLLLGCGIGAAVYAYIDGRQLLLMDRSRADVLFGGLFLMAWTVILISTAMSDLARRLRRPAAL